MILNSPVKIVKLKLLRDIVFIFMHLCALFLLLIYVNNNFEIFHACLIFLFLLNTFIFT